MNILIVAATREELKPILEKFGINSTENIFSFKSGQHTVTVLITGVGTVNTTFHLTKFLAANFSFDLALNAGIAGAFSNKLKIGDVVSVSEECFADIGAEDGDSFISITELGFQKENEFPFVNGKLLNTSSFETKLKKVKAITVNTSHGSETSIEKVKSKFHADIESMEGAAFAYCCAQFKIPWMEVRSISNYIERRDRSKWNIPLAITNLNQWLINFIEAA
ncbi:MAG: futalosine hydrolase [Bacteroidota bacterium]